MRTEIFLLHRQGSLQNTLEDFPMTLLQGLLHGTLGVHRAETCVFVDVGREIPQGSQIGEARKRTFDSGQSGQREVLDDPPVLLKLCQRIHLVPCSENRTLLNKNPVLRGFPSR